MHNFETLIWKKKLTRANIESKEGEIHSKEGVKIYNCIINLEMHRGIP